MKATEVLADLKRRFPNEPEYIQAVEEVITTIEDTYNEYPELSATISLNASASPTGYSPSVSAGSTTKARCATTWDGASSTITP